jgi:hypothetical protein
MKVQSVLTGDSFEVSEDKPIRHSVMVATKARPGDVMIGYVTTYLGLRDWCDMHGFILVRDYPNKASEPQPNEKLVDLF